MAPPPRLSAGVKVGRTGHQVLDFASFFGRARVLSGVLVCLGCSERSHTGGRDAQVDVGADAFRSTLLHVGTRADPRPADGSRERPWPTPDDAAQRARPGDVIFLLPGQHPALTALPEGVELLGAGRDTTTLAGPLVLTAPGGLVGGFTLEGAPLRVEADARLHDLLIAQAHETALVLGATATLDEVSLSAIEAPEGAVQITTAEPITWTGGTLTDLVGPGVVATGADLNLAGVHFTHIGGFAVLGDTGHYVLSGVEVAGATGAALRFLEADTEISTCRLTDVAVDPAQGTGAGLDFIGGVGVVRGCDIEAVERGLRAARGAQVEALAVRIGRALGDGVVVGEAAALQLTDVQVDGAGSGGVSVTGATLTATNLTVRRAGRHGLFVVDGTADLRTVELTDGGARGLAALRATLMVDGLIVRDAPDVCVQITEPVATTLGRLELTHCGGAGISIIGPGAEVALEAADIQDIFLDGTGASAGISLYQTTLAGHDLTVQGSAAEGIRIEQASAHLTDVQLRTTAGPGLAIFAPADPVRVERLTVEAATGAGVLVTEGALTLVAPTVTGTRPDPEIGPGDGIAAAFLGELTVEGGRSATHAGSGLSLAGASTGHLTGGLVLENNAAYGLTVECGSTLVERDYQARGNTRGAELTCR